MRGDISAAQCRERKSNSQHHLFKLESASPTRFIIVSFSCLKGIEASSVPLSFLIRVCNVSSSLLNEEFVKCNLALEMGGEFLCDPPSKTLEESRGTAKVREGGEDFWSVLGAQSWGPGSEEKAWPQVVDLGK